jgi:hypothetical protein
MRRFLFISLIFILISPFVSGQRGRRPVLKPRGKTYIGANASLTGLSISYWVSATKTTNIESELGVSYLLDQIYMQNKLNYMFYKKKNNRVYGGLILGIKRVDNDLYRVIVPYAGIYGGYRRFYKRERYALKIEAGYIYGRNTYTQNYSNEYYSAQYNGLYSCFPVYFSVGFQYFLKKRR